jgi:hypothetical protein
VIEEKKELKAKVKNMHPTSELHDPKLQCIWSSCNVF